jgi:hypothetical protein
MVFMTESTAQTSLFSKSSTSESVFEYSVASTRTPRFFSSSALAYGFGQIRICATRSRHTLRASMTGS